MEEMSGILLGMAIIVFCFFFLGGGGWVLAIWNRWLTHKEEIARIKAGLDDEKEVD